MNWYWEWKGRLVLTLKEEGARIDLDFPRIHVWDCNDIQGVYMLQSGAVNETNWQLEENAAWRLQFSLKRMRQDDYNSWWSSYFNILDIWSNFKKRIYCLLNNYPLMHKIVGGYDNDIGYCNIAKSLKETILCMH